MRSEADIESIKKMVLPFRKLQKIYYCDCVNMNYSFDSLEQLYYEQTGSRLKEGDAFVCDSANMRSRKALIKTETGSLIMYFRLDRNNKTIKGE